MAKVRELLETQFNCRIVQWGEGTDEDMELFSAIQHGRWVRADSLALLISALQDATHRPVVLAA